MHMNTFVPSEKKTSQSAIANTHTHAHSRTHTHTQGGIEAVHALEQPFTYVRRKRSSSLQEQAAGALRNLSANHPENQRKIGAQVANVHEYICAARTCMAAF